MLADPGLVRSGGDVTLGLLDGRMQNRRLVKFSPYLTVLACEPASPKERGEMLPVDTLAYVAFLRKSTERPQRLAAGTATRYRIHVPGGKTFQVETAPPSKQPSPGGFYAVPLDEATPFKEIFFYDRGVRLREGKEPLGAMLVAEGLAQKEDVQRGVSVQNSPLGQILIEQERLTPEVVEAAVATQERKRLRLGEVLIEAGLLTQKEVDLALTEQKNRKGKKIGELLIELNLIKETDLTSTLANKFHLPFINLDEYPINKSAVLEVPKDLVSRYGFLPVASDERSLTVAISDPLYVEVNDVLRFHMKKKRILEVLVTPSQLKKYVADFLAVPDKQEVEMAEPGADLNSILRDLASEEGGVATEAEEEAKERSVNEADSAIIKLANQIIIDAYRRGASDIHIEPNGKERATTVRFRIDGDCVAYQEIPPPFRTPLVSRIKIMADLDISEKRKPQDGKIRFRMRDRKIELRVATVPTVNNNEDIVMRILAGSKPIPLDQMGMSTRNLAEIRKISARPYGLILVVGPTGSGKTTTLHSVLGAINTVDMKIWTAEDPVEITQVGLRQVQVQPKIGFTFAAALRAFLRADPDVIMVGEMRDQETANIAVEASLTGHLVLSTLHTNSAPETVSRLLDMGLDSFSFGDALLGVLAQRLARGLCKSCRLAYEGTREEYDEVATAYGEQALREKLGVTFGPDFKLWRAPGCDACGQTGLKGRVGLHELLIADEEVRHGVQHKARVEELRQAAMKGGMTTLLQDGIAKALAGLTDLRQVLAVCSK